MGTALTLGCVHLFAAEIDRTLKKVAEGVSGMDGFRPVSLTRIADMGLNSNTG